MQPEADLSAAGAEKSRPRIPLEWRTPLIHLAVAWVVLFASLASDWADMADQWWNSSTYNHIVLVPFILVWLVWMRIDELVKLKPQAWWPGLILVAGALFCWLLGAVSGLNLARQLGAVAVLQGAAIAILGPRVTAGLFFPLAYMLFLVPFGEELVPLLQTITAKITIALTHWSGVAAVIEGVFIDTPAGLFEVAEACSGVKFLIAMIALATLVAHVCFTSWKRRLLFMIVAVVLPVLANGVRAWGTIYIAQSQGVAFAAGFDHIFYGWVFFALVMVALLAMGWRFFDRAVDDPLINAERIMASPTLSRLAEWTIPTWSSLIGTLALLALFVAWATKAATLAAPMPDRIDLPEVAGWERASYEPEIWWAPAAGGADHRLLGRYRNAEGQQVDVFFALYSRQDEEREAGGFGQGALMPDSVWRWEQDGPAIEDAKSEWLFAEGRVLRLAATFYRTGDTLTGSVANLKLANMRDSLLMRDRPTMMLILSTEETNREAALQSITAFRQAIDPLGDWMDATAELP